MALLDIATTCEIRKDHGRTCKDCIYYGKICERIKHRYDVSKPGELVEELMLKKRR